MATNRENDKCNCDQECQRQGCSQVDAVDPNIDAATALALSPRAVAKISGDIHALPSSSRRRPTTRQEAIALLGAVSSEGSGIEINSPSRVLCADLVDVEWIGIDGCRELCTANLEEIWRTGATLDLDQAIADGAQVLIRNDRASFRARVLYCQQNLTGYSAGVVFEAGTPWDPTRFVPAHALPFSKTPFSQTVLTASEDSTATSARGQIDNTHNPTDDREAASPANKPRAVPMRQMTLEGLTPLIASGSLVRLGSRLVED